MRRIKSEGLFLLELWKTNLSSAMEYRVSFLSQVLGMMINDGIFFVFWFLFFDRFKEVKGWGMPDMVLLFSIITTGYGLGLGLFGNASRLAEIIAQGRLDYYLALPRNALLHVLASRSATTAWGDLIFGLIAYASTGRFTLSEVVLWITASVSSGIVLVCSFALFGCLSFWLGNASQLASQATNAIMTLALYPMDLFQGAVRFIMLTLLPAAFVGAIPLDIVRRGDWGGAFGLMGVSIVFIVLLSVVFQAGLRRYESGSAFNVNL
ncbi:MAG: ABC-2 family transporter protein [Armatimonadetes bacterium]|nr:ABC-2 family transporter protein [Armatimonadota bacterium]